MGEAQTAQLLVSIYSGVNHVHTDVHKMKDDIA